MNYMPMSGGPGMGGPQEPNQAAMMLLMKYLQQQKDPGFNPMAPGQPGAPGSSSGSGPDVLTGLVNSFGKLGSGVGSLASDAWGAVSGVAGGLESSLASLFDGI